MNLYQGIDLVDIRRIRNVYQRFGKKFIKKILSKKESKCLLNNLSFDNTVRRLASIFALKEAASKAVGTGFSQGVLFSDFEIYYNKLNKPFLNFNTKIESKIKNSSMEKLNTSVSLSNERSYVVAIVTIIISR